MRRIRRAGQTVLFVIKNIVCLINLKNISEVDIDNQITIKGAARKEIKEILAIYSYFNDFRQIAFEKRILYFLVSKKCVFAAKDMEANKIIGVELYYFNNKDIDDHTIHQGFRGVLPAWQGNHIGSKITAHAVNHFKRGCFDGISTRVSLNNIPSLKSNSNQGFRPVEKYFDADMKEERYYLICPFNGARDWRFIDTEK
jgi:GNAT superfamily N-acetyltransferase